MYIYIHFPNDIRLWAETSGRIPSIYIPHTKGGGEEGVAAVAIVTGNYRTPGSNSTTPRGYTGHKGTLT